MARINEHEIFAKYIGEKVNDCRLAELAQRNGNGYGDYAKFTHFVDVLIIRMALWDVRKCFCFPHGWEGKYRQHECQHDFQ